ncbi:MAG: GAF domain-containing protein [Solirubrobacterales bacterium]
MLVGLIAQIEEQDETSGISNRICETVCRTTSLTRAVMFMHDPTVGVSRPTGFHGVPEEVIASVAATLDEMPVAQRVLAEDRVVEISRNLEFELPARYAGMAGITTITCAPVAAGGTWFGVIVADQGGGDYLLSEKDHQRLHTLGRLAAMAATVERSTASRERNRSLDSRVEMIREIHDQVVQRLFGLSLALGSDGDLTAEEQQRCSDEITAVLGELRTALARPVTPEEPAASRPFRELVDWFAESDKITLEWQDGVETPAHLEAMATSALTEALRNAQRHSDGGRVEIVVGMEEGAFSVEVINEQVSPSTGGGGLGLRLLTLEALQNDALIEFGPRADRWHFRLLGPVEK